MIRTAMFMSRVRDAGPSFETAETACLVQQALNGDPAAFECLMLRYERQVVRLAMRFLGTTEDAQDAAQEVFFRAYKYLHRLDLQKPIEPWLMRTTVNVCRNIGRKRQQRLNTFSGSETAAEPATTEFCDPYSGVVEEEERQMLWKALNSLPEKERIAVTLRDIEGMSSEEVCGVLEITEINQRVLLHRGRSRLRQALESEFGRA